MSWNLKEVYIGVGESIKSTGPIQFGMYGDSVYHITVQSQNWVSTDAYSVAYAKRINYWLKNDTTGKIVTQGTLYYCEATGYTKYYVSYGADVGIEAMYDNVRLYLEEPGGNGSGAGKVDYFTG